MVLNTLVESFLAQLDKCRTEKVNSVIVVVVFSVSSSQSYGIRSSDALSTSS